MERPGPRHVPAAPLQSRIGRPVGRVIIESADLTDPSFFEWELRGEEWSDEHAHDEYVYVLAGEVHVTAEARTVVAGPGDLVVVPAGSRGFYAAPDHARLLSVYGPRPATQHDPHGVLRPLSPG